ncbi:MAG: hypothetical protein GQ574_26535 [Crocinitomix sp.]|nr:hypothetical protein [Crocinitomix sp.]
MLHFVLADIDPTKAHSFELFLKEMNEIALLITVAGAPFVSHEALILDEVTGLSTFKVVEGDYEVRFKGQTVNGTIASGYFEVFEDQKRLLEISYSIKPNSAIALRAKLNCEGEYMVREELERAFERDFSQEAHEYMKKPLEELRKPKLEVPDAKELLEELRPSEIESPSENVAPSSNDEAETLAEEDVEQNVEEDLEEITEELSELTEKVQGAIIDTQYMIAMLNNLSHDLTRGATINFGERKCETKTLENGAMVEMLDDDSNDYKITFRKGSLDEMTEVSFFLERDDVLIFSVYFSSEGVGRIASSSDQSNIIFKKVKHHLL